MAQELTENKWLGKVIEQAPTWALIDKDGVINRTFESPETEMKELMKIWRGKSCVEAMECQGVRLVRVTPSYRVTAELNTI